MLSNIAFLWSRQLAGRTALSWTMWFSVAFSYYAFFSWIPSLLVKHGMTITRSFGYSIAIYAAQVPGYFSAAYLNEKLDRKGVVASYMVCGGLSALALAMAHTELQILAAGILLSFFMNGHICRGLCLYAGAVPDDGAHDRRRLIVIVRANRVGKRTNSGRIHLSVVWFRGSLWHDNGSAPDWRRHRVFLWDSDARANSRRHYVR